MGKKSVRLNLLPLFDCVAPPSGTGLESAEFAEKRRQLLMALEEMTLETTPEQPEQSEKPEQPKKHPRQPRQPKRQKIQVA